MPWKELFTLTCLCLAANLAYASPVAPHLKAILGSMSPDEEVSVIVTLKEKADTLRMTQAKARGISRRSHRQQILEILKSTADRTQMPLKTLLKSRKASKVRSLVIKNGLAFTASAHVIREVAAQPEVERVTLDSLVTVPPVKQGAEAVSEWNIDAVRAPVLWDYGYTGQGIVVATMDTGVDLLHPDLSASWRGGTNSWYDPNGQHSTPFDADGHGTSTMGVIIGGSSGGTNIGVAPGAQWIAVKIFNDAGEGSLSGIHQGFDWLLDPDGNPATDDAPDVVNSSWGLVDGSVNQCVDEFEADIQTLKAAGIAVVFSAGNSGPNPSSSVSPANYPDSFSVGAVDEGLMVGTFSGRGPSACDGRIFPEVVAPGVNIKTADLTFGGVRPFPYTFVTGTSFSAPHISGTMALLMSAFPNVTLSQLEEVLKTTAFELGPIGSDNTYGYGLVNASTAFLALNGTSPETITVTSYAALDGWILESVGGSSIGGFVRKGLVRVGDDRRNRQQKGIISFDTSQIPVNAEILSATLKLTRKRILGADPSLSLGILSVDVMKGTFNEKRLQKVDFEEPASAPQAADMFDPGLTGGISTGILNINGINAINKGGITQLRLSFSLPTDGDRTADSIIFFSGKLRFKEKRPSLEITYLP